MRASCQSNNSSTTMITTRVSPWTAKLIRPSWNNMDSASMSEVILVIKTPAFSSV